MKPAFESGINIAIKIPKRNYDKAIGFYREVLKLEIEEGPIGTSAVSRTHRIKFGENTLWLDCIDDDKDDEIKKEV